MVGSVRVTTYAEYLQAERAAETKHEFRDGVIVAMSGGTLEHARLQLVFQSSLNASLVGRRCLVLPSDARVRVMATNRAFYSDGLVVCGSIERAPDDHDAVTNPVVIVEVLSESTEGYDRGEKARHYRRLESLREYVLMSQTERLVEVWEPDGRSWRTREYGPGETIELRSLDVRIPVDALHAESLA